MAVINKLRSSGWVLIVILLALVLFVVNDLVNNWKKINSGGADVVGIIDGENVKYQDYELAVKQRESQVEQQGNKLDPATKESIKDQVWEELFKSKVVEKEYAKAGLTVSPSEMNMLLLSQDAHPIIKQYFSDANGVFNPGNVKEFLKKSYPNNKMMQEQFDNIVKYIKNDAITKKYVAITRNGIYATKLDAEDDFYSQSQTVTGKIVTLNYQSVEDKDIKITDKDLQDYLDAHKDDYKQEAARDLEFVSWNIAPSAQDSADVKKWCNNEVVNFKTTPNDTVYISQYSEVPFDTTFHARGTLYPAIEEQVFNAPVDSVIGPVYYEGGYSLFKVLAAKEDSSYYLRASQITIPVKGVTKADTMNAIEEGKKLIAEAKSTADFAAFAKAKSALGYYAYNSNGDLGWWKEGQQTKEVNDAVKKGNKGDVMVVKTPIGIQLVKITEAKTRKLVNVAELRQKIVAQSATIEDAYKKANTFRQTLTTGANDEFYKKAEKAGLAIRVANDVSEKTRVLAGISEAREIVRWAYNDRTKLHDVSQIFTLDNKQIIVHLANIKEEGTAKLKDVKAKIEVIVKREKKAEILKKKFEEAMAKAKTPEDVAIGVKSIAQPIDKVNFAMPNVPMAGNDVKVVGYVMGLKEKTMGKPFPSNDGVHVAYIESITKPELPKEFPMKEFITMNLKQNAERYVFEALKKSSDIKDFRFKFY